jgi:hypothetical protein
LFSGAICNMLMLMLAACLHACILHTSSSSYARCYAHASAAGNACTIHNAHVLHAMLNDHVYIICYKDARLQLCSTMCSSADPSLMISNLTPPFQSLQLPAFISIPLSKWKIDNRHTAPHKYAARALIFLLPS